MLEELADMYELVDDNEIPARLPGLPKDVLLLAIEIFKQHRSEVDDPDCDDYQDYGMMNMAIEDLEFALKKSTL